MGHKNSEILPATKLQHIKPDKGIFLGACHRIACQASPATQYSQSTQRYYCTSCAERLNRENPPGVELFKCGIKGCLCVDTDNVLNPFYGYKVGTPRPSYTSNEIRQICQNICDANKGTRKDILMKKVIDFDSRIPFVIVIDTINDIVK